jgi:hypothetical protein
MNGLDVDHLKDARHAWCFAGAGWGDVEQVIGSAGDDRLCFRYASAEQMPGDLARWEAGMADGQGADICIGEGLPAGHADRTPRLSARTAR